MKLGVLRFSGDENGNVLVGVFPQCEEILISRLGLSGVALHGLGAGEAQVRQCPGPAVPDDAAVVEDSLEFDYGRISICRRQVRLASNIHGVKTGILINEGD
jgi:hypothetical protein